MKVTKLLSVLLAVLMVASVLPIAVVADDVYEILNNPSIDNPTFEVSSPEDVKSYKWTATILEEVPITDENASDVCANCEGNYSSVYDAESGYWTGSKICEMEDGYQIFVFTVTLEAGERIYIDATPEVESLTFFDYDNFAGYQPSFWLVGNIGVFTADYAGTYSLLAVTPSLDSKIRAFGLNIYEDILLEDETEATLGDLQVGRMYECTATYQDDSALTSKTLIAFPDVINEPASDDFTFEVYFEDDAAFQWYEAVEDGVVAIEGENSKTLSSPEFGKVYYCEASFPYAMVLESEYVSILSEIVSQPDTKDPTFEVTYEEEATFQWYEVTEKVIGVIDDTMVEEALGTYDAETFEWTPDAGEPYEYAGYEEYEFVLFDIYLEEGQTVKATISNPDAPSPEDPDLRFSGYDDTYHAEWDENGVATFTAPISDVYYVYQYAIYPETATFNFEIISYDLEEIEGETDKTLKNPAFGKQYSCKASFSNHLLESDVFTANGYIISQPAPEDVTVEVAFEEEATFQWYEAISSIVLIDDAMADYCYGTYDAETGEWTPDAGEPYEYSGYEEYEFELFDVYLEEGQTVNVTISNPDALSPEDPDMRFSGEDDTYYAEWDENGVTTFTAPASGIYYIYQYAIYPETATFKFETEIYEYTLLEGETEKTLSNFEMGKRYRAEVTYSNSDVLNSNIVRIVPAITKQPTAESPSVEVNAETEGMKYQWYMVVIDTVNVTDEIADPAYYGEEAVGDPSYYDEENECWIPSLYGIYTDGDNVNFYEYDIFEIYVEEGQTLCIVPSGEVIEDSFDFMCEDDPLECIISYEDGVFSFTSAKSQSYYFYVESYEEEITFTATISDYASFEQPFEGADSSALNAREAGTYVCVITFADGTELVSDIVTLTEDDIAILGDVNGDGEIDQYDYILVKRHYFETRLLTDDEMTRADVNKDSEVDQFDYILIARHYFGTYEIK